VICKGIIEGLKGKIWLESKFGRGTSFFVCFPVAEKKVVVPKLA